MSRLRFGACLFALGCALVPAHAEVASDALSVTARIAGADGKWDFSEIDPQTGRLLVARSNGVMAVDLATRKVTDTLVPGAGVHGVLPLPGTPFAISTNGKSANAVLFDIATGKVEATLPTGQSPDALVFEPKSGLVVVFNGKSHDASLIDAKARAVVGSIALDGKPEVGAVDGEGHVFVNLEDKATIAVLDIAARKTVATYALPGCEAPTGLAYDAATGVLIAACDNEVAKVIDAKSGRDLATLKIGKGPDGVLLDAARRRAFVPTADGNLTMISLKSASEITVAGSVTTAPGARSGALDPATGALYLPTAKMAAPKAQGERPEQIPGSFEILVVTAK